MSRALTSSDPSLVPRLRLEPIDALLLLMTLIWGANYSVLKTGLREIPHLAFNSLRLLIASAVYLAMIAYQIGRCARSPNGKPDPSTSLGAPGHVSARDWAALAALGFVGHFLYQLCFMGGLARTTVAHSSLIIGCSPVAVTLLSSAIGQERITGWHWAGLALSVFGIYLVVGRSSSAAGSSVVGDLLTIAAIVCWAGYTVGARPLLTRHSALVVTGYSTAIGTAMYVPVGLPELRRLDWSAVSAGAWLALVFSAIFAVALAYLIWYSAVQRIGNARTSVYSNMVPVAALAVAVVWLGERLESLTLLGAAAILSGVALTKVRPSAATPPPEE